MTDYVQAGSPEAGAAQDSNGNATDGQTTSPDIGKLLKGNTALLVWLVFLTLGGGILALYYARIGYLPDIEWSSSIVYLAAASFIGGGVGLLFALSLLLPGLIWAEALLCDPGLVKVFRYEKSNELCLRTIFRRLGLPFGVVLVTSHFALRADHFVGSGKVLAIVYVSIAVVLMVMTFLFMQWRFNGAQTKPVICDGLKEEQAKSYPSTEKATHTRPSVNNQPTEPAITDQTTTDQNAIIEREAKRRIFKYSSWFALSVFLSQISMLVVYRLSGKLPWFYFFVLTGVCTLGVLISNHVVAVRYSHNPRQAVAASLVATAVLLFVADRFSSVSEGVMSLSEGVMSRYGFGSNQKFTLLVDDEGAAIIMSLGLPNEAWGRICDVEILSRLGNEYYLRVGGSGRTAGRNFTLPKSSVKAFISMSEVTDGAVGQRHTVNLLVNDEGAALIEKLDLRNTCSPPSRERLCGVEIISTLGTEYYLRVGHSDGIVGRTFTLPKSTVKSFISTDD